MYKTTPILCTAPLVYRDSVSCDMHGINSPLGNGVVEELGYLSVCLLRGEGSFILFYLCLVFPAFFFFFFIFAHHHGVKGRRIS